MAFAAPGSGGAVLLLPLLSLVLGAPSLLRLSRRIGVGRAGSCRIFAILFCLNSAVVKDLNFLTIFFTF